MIKTRYTEIAPYVTKDGSLIRELMHPQVHGNRTSRDGASKPPSSCPSP